MPDGYSRSPLLLKGALVRLSEPFLDPVPTVIVFQYNPETVTRQLTPWNPPSTSKDGGKKASESGTTAPYDPEESFTLTLEFDATDMLEEPEQNPVEVVSGVRHRISALEMLLYPTEESLLGTALQAVTGVDAVPRGEVPIVMLVWGPGMIVPVRLTSFSVEEQAFSPLLYPVRAKVTVGLKVLTPSEIKKLGTKPSIAKDLAITAYKYTHAQREALSTAKTASNAMNILGLLPF